MSPVKSTATISAIIAVAVVVIIVWLIAKGKETVTPPVEVVVPIVNTTEVPADGQPATVTEVKTISVTTPAVTPTE